MPAQALADVEIENALDDAHGAFFGSDVERGVGRCNHQQDSQGAEKHSFTHRDSLLQKIFAEHP